MHVFIGGAYTGKRKYVENLLREQQVTDVQYYEGELPQQVPSCGAIVISGIDKWLCTQELENEDKLAMDLVHKLKSLNDSSPLFVIVTDMGRGVVPIERHLRQLRDVSGRFYQALFKEATSVTRIWYGIPEIMK